MSVQAIRDKTGKVIAWRSSNRAPPDNKPHTKQFKLRRDAQDYDAEVRARLKKRAWANPHNPTTVVEHAYEYLDARAGLHRETTQASKRSIIDTHLAGTRLGGRRLVDVKPTEVQIWLTERGKGLAPSTVRNIRKVIAAVFAQAVANDLISKSPVTKDQVKAPRMAAERVDKVLTVEEVRRLAGAMDEIGRPECKAMVITAAGLGLRPGETRGLRVEDVDWLNMHNPMVRVQTQVTGSSRERVDPKHESFRTVPAPGFVMDALKAHTRDFPAERGRVDLHHAQGRGVLLADARANRQGGVETGRTECGLVAA